MRLCPIAEHPAHQDAILLATGDEFRQSEVVWFTTQALFWLGRIVFVGHKSILPTVGKYCGRDRHALCLHAELFVKMATALQSRRRRRPTCCRRGRQRMSSSLRLSM